MEANNYGNETKFVVELPGEMMSGPTWIAIKAERVIEIVWGNFCSFVASSVVRRKGRRVTFSREFSRISVESKKQLWFYKIFLYRKWRERKVFLSYKKGIGYRGHWIKICSPPDNVFKKKL